MLDPYSTAREIAVPSQFGLSPYLHHTQLGRANGFVLNCIGYCTNVWEVATMSVEHGAPNTTRWS